MRPGAVFTTEVINELVGLGVGIFGDIANINVDEPFKQLLFNATNNYAQTYAERHGHVQVLGISPPIPLDNIYSGVQMLDTETMKSYASSTDLEKAYRKRNGIEVAKKNHRLIVLGDPGIGKSSFLRKVGLEALKGNVGDYQLPYIPVFLELKQFRSTEIDLQASISAAFSSCGFPSPEGFTENALKKGKLLLLFDGLDEVSPDHLDTVIERIQALMHRYSGTRFMVSCRMATYHAYFKYASIVEIAAFDDDQMERFIHNWFSSELDQKNQTAEQCWERLKQPENRGAKELAQSPLLLTFLCLVYDKSVTVPSNRTTLYREALDILLEEWATEKRVRRGEIYEGFHSDLEQELLAKIAYEGFVNDQLFFSQEQIIASITDFLGNKLDAPKNLSDSAVLERIGVQPGILVKSGADIYTFSHLTFQEFLAAKYIVIRNLQGDLVKLHGLDDYWKEVFLFVAGLMKGDAITFLEKLEIQTQELSEHPSVKGLLAWLKAKTSSTASDYSGEIKRVSALLLFFDLALTSDLANASEIASEIDRFVGPITFIVYSIYQTLDIIRDRISDFDSILANTSDRASVLTRVLNRALSHTRIFYLDRYYVFNNTHISILDLADFLASARNSARKLSNTRSLCHILANASTRFSDLGSDLTSAISRYYANASAQDINRINNIEGKIDSNQDRNITNASASARSVDRTIDRAIDINRVNALDGAKSALNNQLLSNVDLQTLIFCLENLSKASRTATEELIPAISSSLDISPEFFDWSKDDVEVISDYLSTCQLMVECSKQASGLSAQQWAAIKQRMFLPAQS